MKNDEILESTSTLLAQLKAVLLPITTYGVIVIVCVSVGISGVGIVDKS